MWSQNCCILLHFCWKNTLKQNEMRLNRLYLLSHRFLTLMNTISSPLQQVKTLTWLAALLNCKYNCPEKLFDIKLISNTKRQNTYYLSQFNIIKRSSLDSTLIFLYNYSGIMQWTIWDTSFAAIHSHCRFLLIFV